MGGRGSVGIVAIFSSFYASNLAGKRASRPHGGATHPFEQDDTNITKNILSMESFSDISVLGFVYKYYG